ncbi:hypothetical protein [Tateyamaria pelophila]|uniref:hypothetical protein n=1 Tax=Tateyamaria pelophila TaxID=328415 RepID=UPI001CC1861A|nr:hypothetical protein [Tateyamaria pelophila]
MMLTSSKADPVQRRQGSQWQMENVAGTLRASNRTAPHRHPPLRVVPCPLTLVLCLFFGAFMSALLTQLIHFLFIFRHFTKIYILVIKLRIQLKSRVNRVFHRL